MKYVLVNFGGPRNLEEVESFLIELLTDRDLIQTRWPNWLHRAFFRRVAKKRARFVREDYACIGGGSPIFEDTEALARALQEILQAEVLPFHRYLPGTHAEFVERIHAWKAEEIRVIPLFPQFSFTTTGSIARWFVTHLSPVLIQQMQWVRSYPDHPAFISAYQEQIQRCLKESDVPLDKTLLLFSAHGLPVRYVREGDPYAQECERSFLQISAAFPLAGKQLCYQSLFGKEEWIRPYTAEFCKAGDLGNYRRVIVVPLSFTSDHIETLFEIENQYLPLLRQQGVEAVRCPALNRDPLWIQGLAQLANEMPVVTGLELIRR